MFFHQKTFQRSWKMNEIAYINEQRKVLPGIDPEPQISQKFALEWSNFTYSCVIFHKYFAIFI